MDQEKNFAEQVILTVFAAKPQISFVYRVLRVSAKSRDLGQSPKYKLKRRNCNENST